MARVVIYRTDYCPYCDMAKRLFDSLDIEYEQIDVTEDAALRAELIERTGGKRTVPQIFIDDVPVGGFTDVQALHRSGKLASMLGQES
jgi:glutaredoxin 3